MNNTQNIKNNKILLKFFSGVILSVIFIVLGYVINDSVGRDITPSFENIISKSIIILFIGLLSGYNIAISLKKGNAAYYFYAGMISPIFIIVLYGLLMNNEYFSTVLIILGLSFSIIFLNSGLVESHSKYKLLIDLISKYLPNLTVITIAIGDFGMPMIGFSINYEFGLYGYIPGIIIALILLYAIQVYEE